MVCGKDCLEDKNGGLGMPDSIIYLLILLQ
jgi:hypothetical protein